MVYQQYRKVCTAVLVFLYACSICQGELDKNKYIGIDEIKVGMKGIALPALKAPMLTGSSWRS